MSVNITLAAGQWRPSSIVARAVYAVARGLGYAAAWTAVAALMIDRFDAWCARKLFKLR